MSEIKNYDYYYFRMPHKEKYVKIVSIHLSVLILYANATFLYNAYYM